MPLESPFDLVSRLVVGYNSTPNWSLEQDLALYRKLDLKVFDTSSGKLSKAPLETWQSLIRDAGLRLQTVILGPPYGFDLSDPSSWKDSQLFFIDWLHSAEQLGASQCSFSGGSAHGKPFELAAAAFAEAIAPVAQVASDLGIRLLFEPVRPQFAHFGFVHSLRDGVTVARQTRLGLVFDVVHCWWEKDLADTLLQNIDLIGNVHLADLNFSGPLTERVIPGDGELPLADLISTVVASGYDGLFDVELVGSALESEGYEVAIPRALKYLSELQLTS